MSEIAYPLGASAAKHLLRRAVFAESPHRTHGGGAGSTPTMVQLWDCDMADYDLDMADYDLDMAEH